MITKIQMYKIRKMNLSQLDRFLVDLYKSGYTDGLKDGETEFDDALILSEEEAAEYFGQEAINRAILETKSK